MSKRSTQRRRRDPSGITSQEGQRPEQRLDAVVSGDRKSTRPDAAAAGEYSTETPVIDSRLRACALSDGVSDSSSDSSSDEELKIFPGLDHKARHELSSEPCRPALSPYQDERSTIKTYFKIYSPSKGGRMLSVYESKPDDFNLSQSWGWKSSTLVVDDDAASGEAPEHADASLKKRSQKKPATTLFSGDQFLAHLEENQETIEVDRINIEEDGAMHSCKMLTAASDGKARAKRTHLVPDGKLRFSVVLGVV